MITPKPTLSPGSANLSGKRVLIVEDDFFIASDMAEDFSRFGAEVLGPVPSIADALKLLDEVPTIDGAILDISLSDGMSYPLAEALERRGVPFVFSTAYEPQLLPAAYRDVPLHQKPVDAMWIAKSLFSDP